MKKTIASFALILLSATICRAAVITVQPSSKGGTDYRLISLQPVDPKNPEIVAIYEFEPKSFDFYGQVTDWKYTRTLLPSTTLTSLKQYVSTHSKLALTEEEALKNLEAVSKKAERSKKHLGWSVASMITGPVGPAVLWLSSMANSLSASELEEKTVQLTHPFSLLNVTQNRASVLIEDKDWTKLLQSEIEAYLTGKDSSFDKHVSEIKEADEAKAKRQQSSGLIDESCGCQISP